MTLEELERAAIIRTHDWTDDVSQTAQMLGVSERKVYYKLKEYRESGFLPLDDSGRCDDDDREEGGGASMPRLLIAE
ncbi:MAG: helix-turn-helix domain-containing protein, partial [Bradymonadaceae bacterium]